MKLILASNNVGKLAEYRALFEPLGISVVSQSEAGIDLEVDENGTSFEENAALKARSIYNIGKCAVVADDSGLCVDALGGAPGIYSARFAPKGMLCEKLLGELEGVPCEKRGAHFVCVICLIDENGNETLFRGECFGKIGLEKRGTGGFGYDPVFVCENGKSFAELSEEEKNEISHRALAMKKLAQARHKGQ